MRHSTIAERLPDGSTRSECPACGYVRVLRPPSQTSEVLVPGDRDAIHSGGSVGVSMTVELNG